MGKKVLQIIKNKILNIIFIVYSWKIDRKNKKQEGDWYIY